MGDSRMCKKTLIPLMLTLMAASCQAQPPGKRPDLADCLPAPVESLRQWTNGLPSGRRSSVADANDKWTKRAERAACEWVVKVIDKRWLPSDVNVLRKDMLMVQNAIGPNDVAYSRWEANGCAIQATQTGTIMLVQVHPDSAYMQPRLTIESRRALVMGMITRLVNRETDVVVTAPTSRKIERREIMPELLAASFEQGRIEEYAAGVHCIPMHLDSKGSVQNPKFWWQAVRWWTDGRDVSFCLLKTEGGQWAASYNSKLDETWFEGPPSPSKRIQ